MVLDGFFRKITDAVSGRTNEDPMADFDPNNRLDEDAAYYEQQARPASEDPYGDPADYGDYGQFGDVRPASEDPYGDPADYSEFGNVLPASEDPYGDPADQENFY